MWSRTSGSRLPLSSIVRPDVSAIMTKGSAASETSNSTCPPTRSGAWPAVDRLNDVLPVLLPLSDSKIVRDLLPRLAKLKRTADLEDEAEQEMPPPALSAAQPSEHE